MDWLTAVVEGVKALVWPTVVGILVISQRRSISTLVSGLKPRSAKGFGAEIDFDQRIEQVEGKVEAAREEIANPVDQDPPAVDTDVLPRSEVSANMAPTPKESITADFHEEWGTGIRNGGIRDRDMQRLRPEFRIDTSWRTIESLLRELLYLKGAEPPNPINVSVSGLLKFARSKQILPSSAISALQDLYDIRNRVLHRGYEPVSPGDAERYSDSASSLEWMLRILVSSQRGIKTRKEP